MNLVMSKRNQSFELEYNLFLSANVAFIALQAAKIGVLPKESKAFAKKQINYMLGSTGRSFVVGFGRNPPKRVHHRGA